jgi:hypothetical protein
MGLLDDAIREHLELKRRRGADPGEVAREQQEALEPVVPVQPVAEEGDGGPPDDAAVEDPQEAVSPEVPHVDQAPEETFPLPGLEDAAPDPEFSAGAQETAELDMESVLHDDHFEPNAPAGGVLVDAMPDGTDAQPSEEPRGAEEEILDEHGEVPGQEHLRFD